MLTLAIIAVPLFFFTAMDSANSLHEPMRYDVRIIPAYVADAGHDPFSAIQIRNPTDRRRYGLEVTLDLYTDAESKQDVFAPCICVASRNEKDSEQLRNYLQPYGRASAVLFIPELGAKESFEFYISWRAPLAIVYSSVSVFDADRGLGGDTLVAAGIETPLKKIGDGTFSQIQIEPSGAPISRWRPTPGRLRISSPDQIVDCALYLPGTAGRINKRREIPGWSFLAAQNSSNSGTIFVPGSVSLRPANL